MILGIYLYICVYLMRWIIRAPYILKAFYIVSLVKRINRHVVGGLF